MASIGGALSDLFGNVIAVIVLLVLAILGFFLTVFVVSSGAGVAGFAPSGDFVVLSAAIITAASVLGGIMQE